MKDESLTKNQTILIILSYRYRFKVGEFFETQCISAEWTP